MPPHIWCAEWPTLWLCRLLILVFPGSPTWLSSTSGVNSPCPQDGRIIWSQLSLHHLCAFAYWSSLPPTNFNFCTHFHHRPAQKEESTENEKSEQREEILLFLPGKTCSLGHQGAWRGCKCRRGFRCVRCGAWLVQLLTTLFFCPMDYPSGNLACEPQNSTQRPDTTACESLSSHSYADWNHGRASLPSPACPMLTLGPHLPWGCTTPPSLFVISLLRLKMHNELSSSWAWYILSEPCECCINTTHFQGSQARLTPSKGGDLFWMSPPLAPRRNVKSLQHHLTTPMESNNKSGGKKN